MLWNRIIYAIVAVSSAAAFILTDSNVALYLCVCVLALPAVSFLLLFFAAKKVSFDYDIGSSCIRGNALTITFKAKISPRFLAGAVLAVVETENTTFHKIERRRFLFKDLSFAPHTYDYVSADSGRITVKIKNIKITDIFGVCSLNVKCAKVVEATVSPVLYDEVSVGIGVKNRGSFSGETSLPEKGFDHSELFNVRDYAAGDSLNSIHWKMTAKFDGLKVKEFGSTDDHKTLILADLSREKNGERANDAQLNAVLDVTVSVSDALKTQGYAHTVGWFVEGTFCGCEVSDSNSFVQMVSALMSNKVDPKNAESLFYLLRSAECAAFTKIVFVSPSVWGSELKECSSLEITAVAVGYKSGELDEENYKIINMPCDEIGAALSNCVL